MTNAELAILSLIVEAPRHGYELDQVIEQRGMRNWTEVGYSSIYYLLKKLQDNKLITSRTKQVEGRGPARKVYHPTETGKHVCYDAIINALETPHRCYPPIQLGICNLEHVPGSEAVAALIRHREGLEERLANIKATRKRQQPVSFIVDAMFDYSIAEMTGRIGWIENFVTRLKQKT